MSEITYSKLDFNDKHKLLDAITNILVETEAHDMSASEEHIWDWQFLHLPTGESHIYVAKDKDKIVGYYHIPTYKCSIHDKPFIIGQIQAVAILKAYRGGGVFRKLAEYANEDINKHIDLIYTFPNHRSIHTFIKYNNFKSVGMLPVYIKPLKSQNLIPEKLKFLKPIKPIWLIADSIFKIRNKGLKKTDKVEEYNSIDNEIENLFQQYNNLHKNHLIRDKQYLDWRYLKSPKGVHRIYGLKSNNNLKAVIVVKEEVIFSSEGLVIMDFAFESVADLHKLISQLHRISNIDASFIFGSGFGKGWKTLPSNGFIPVPKRIVPRKLNLLTRWCQPQNNISLTDSSEWLVNIGDWDVF